MDLIRAWQYTGIFSHFRYLGQTGVAYHNIVTPHMLEITCNTISIFMVKMGDSTEMDTVPKKRVALVWDHFEQCIDSKGKVSDSDTAVLSMSL